MHSLLHNYGGIIITGTWAELALGNLQKILKVVSSHEAETVEETGSPRKRVCVRVSGDEVYNAPAPTILGIVGTGISNL